MPDEPTLVYLVRHAESESNRHAGRVTGGRTDTPLTDEGHRQAVRLARRFSDTRLAAIVSSPLIRARATAEAVALQQRLTVLVDPRLREMDFGAWEGRPGDDLELQAALEAVPPEPGPDFAAPDGESLREVRERMLEAYENLIARHQGGAVMLMSHGVALGQLIAGLLGLPYERSWRLDLGHTGIAQVRQYAALAVLAFGGGPREEGGRG